MSDRDARRDAPASPTEGSPGPTPSPPPPAAPTPHRRRVFGRRYRTRASSNQQWIFIGIAILFLAAYFVGREACARKVASTYGAATGASRRDAGAEKPRPRPRPAVDSDGW